MERAGWCRCCSWKAISVAGVWHFPRLQGLAHNFCVYCKGLYTADVLTLRTWRLFTLAVTRSCDGNTRRWINGNILTGQCDGFWFLGFLRRIWFQVHFRMFRMKVWDSSETEQQLVQQNGDIWPYVVLKIIAFRILHLICQTTLGVEKQTRSLWVIFDVDVVAREMCSTHQLWLDDAFGINVKALESRPPCEK